MELTPTWPHLVQRLIFPICASLFGMSGFIILISLLPTLSRKNTLADVLALQRMREILRHMCHLTPASESALSNKVKVAKRVMFNIFITAILGDSVSVPNGPLPDQVEDPYDLEPYGDDEGDLFLMPEADFVDTAGKPMLQQSFTDTLINLEEP
jgi:hypothetical protein